MMCIPTYRGMSISMWEASAIYAAISGTEAVVPIEKKASATRFAKGPASGIRFNGLQIFLKSLISG